MTHNPLSHNHQLSVLVVTTSFPTNENPVSGIFVKRLLDNMPSHVDLKVLTPCGVSRLSFGANERYKIECFRYAPWKWQRLAHQPGGIPAALENGFFMKLLLPVFLLSLLIRCFREIPKVNVIHANWSVNGFICAIANIFARRPLVLTLRGTDINKANRSIVYRYILRAALNGSKVVTVVSQAMQNALSTDFPAISPRMVMVPNGVDRNLMDIALRKKKHSKDCINVLVIANLIKLKNVALCIRAVARLKNQLAVKLTIVGDGPEKKSLRKLVVEFGLQNDVKFQGSVDPDNIASYLEDADCLVLTSSSEGKPNVVLEAFAAGLPVIASAIDGVTEMIGEDDNGLLFESGNEIDLAQKIQKLFYSDVLYEKYSKCGRDYVVKNRLLWGDTGERFADIYSALVQTTR